MYFVDEATHELLDILTHGLEPGVGRKINNAPAVARPVFVLRLGTDIFSVAHYEEDGDTLYLDPEVEFWRAPGCRWVPTSANVSGDYVEAVQMVDGAPGTWSPAIMSQLIEYCDVWLGENVVSEQGGLPAITAAVGL